MPTQPPADLQLGIAAPLDTVAAFQQRALLEPSFRWQDVLQQEHGRAFAVAGVMRLDLLQAFQDEIATSLQDGRSLADFRGRMRSRLAQMGFAGPQEITDPDTGESRTIGFNDSRLRTVFDVNMRQSEAAGRWARIERNKRRFPYVMYRTMRDERVRAQHRAWDGVTLPVDDSWWDTHYPPCGWRCRCRAFAVSERDIERRRADGLPVKTEAPPDQWISYVNPRTGEVVPVPRGVDPGFAYNPGKQRDAALHEQLLRKALKATPLAGASVVARATQDHQAMLADAVQSFGEFVDKVLAERVARGQLRFIGAIRAPAVRALRDREIEPATAAIAVRDEDVLHALRAAKGEKALPPALYKRLPLLLADATAVLRDTNGGLLYVIDLAGSGGRVAKLVLLLDFNAKVAGERGAVLNVVRTATVMNPQVLRDAKAYELLWGTL
jgi:SPP1 gp7 family putative phage head morphogenesis protein